MPPYLQLKMSTISAANYLNKNDENNKLEKIEKQLKDNKIDRAFGREITNFQANQDQPKQVVLYIYLPYNRIK